MLKSLRVEIGENCKRSAVRHTTHITNHKVNNNIFQTQLRKLLRSWDMTESEASSECEKCKPGWVICQDKKLFYKSEIVLTVRPHDLMPSWEISYRTKSC